MASNAELAVTYAALILHDDGIPITADKLESAVKAAGVDVESYWFPLFAKMLANQDVDSLLTNLGGGGGGGGMSGCLICFRAPTRIYLACRDICHLCTPPLLVDPF